MNKIIINFLYQIYNYIKLLTWEDYLVCEINIIKFWNLEISSQGKYGPVGT